MGGIIALHRANMLRETVKELDFWVHPEGLSSHVCQG